MSYRHDDGIGPLLALYTATVAAVLGVLTLLGRLECASDPVPLPEATMPDFANSGNVLRVELEFQDSNTQGKIKNFLHYRVLEVQLSEQVLQQDSGNFWDAIASHFERLFTQMSTTTYLRRIALKNLSIPAMPYYDRVYASNAFRGDLTTLVAATDQFIPQASACIVRKSFRAGRASMGRVFFGPLRGRFIDNGYLIQDPTGDGDLVTVLDCLGDPIDISAAETFTLLARPVVCKADGTGVTETSDVRIQRFAPLVTFLRSRRQTVGE